MQKAIIAPVLLTLLFYSTTLQAEDALCGKESCTQIIKSVISNLVADNAQLVKSRPAGHFEEFSDIQNPRTTMVLCSDSRVQVENFSQGAENDIFVARNIGNQFITT